MNKIFGIGLNKTGTKTLGECLKTLGYRHSSAQKGLLKDIVLRNDYSTVFKHVNSLDSFEDWPWPLIYKELDSKYPNSRFILTIRKDEFTWLNSLKKHSLRTKPLNNHRKFAYGFEYPFGHEDEHINFYKQHNAEVIEYFKNRPNDLLVICWENGDGWEKLGQFLGKDTLDVPVPHMNEGRSKKRDLSAVSRVMVNKILSYLLKNKPIKSYTK